jgi:hypothetical protein
VRRTRRLRLGVLVVVALATGVCHTLERRRLAIPLHAAGGIAPSRLDAAQMLRDQRELASDRFEGRAVSTPGGRLAAEHVVARFASLGLRAFRDRFVHPFSFEHRSIRALWRRDRPFVKSFDEARNVVGYVQGAIRPDGIIVVSAHFDHLGVRDGAIYHGADDNASGTAALLAIAAHVARRPLTHTIVFAAFDAEELGLRGAEAFVRELPFARERVRLAINLDMISRGDNGRLFVAGTYHYPQLTDIVAVGARDAGVAVHLGHDRPFYLTGFVDDWTSASDHGAFHDVGIPFLYFGVEDHSDVHAPSDTADRVDPRFYAAAAEAAFSTLIAADAALR